MKRHRGGNSDRHYPILEFDADTSSVVEPRVLIEEVDFPEVAVACFFREIIRALEDSGLPEIAKIRSEMGYHPVLELIHNGVRMAAFHACEGAPLAAVLLEEVIAHGCKGVIACGGAGTLSSAVPRGQAIVPTAAVRDEGTSYHYLPPAREVLAGQKALRALEIALQEKGVEHLMGKTWTTDAVYRETRGKVKARAREGCIAVEMEAAALFAVARFRKVEMGELLYAVKTTPVQKLRGRCATCYL